MRKSVFVTAVSLAACATPATGQISGPVDETYTQARKTDERFRVREIPEPPPVPGKLRASAHIGPGTIAIGRVRMDRLADRNQRHHMTSEPRWSYKGAVGAAWGVVF